MMRNGGQTTTIAVAAILAACSPPPKTEAPVVALAVDTAAIAATIRAGEAKWGAEYEARDAEAVGAHYALDAVFMPLDAPPFRGREALIAAMKTAPADKDYTMVFAPESVDVAASGDLAVSIGSFEQHRSIPTKVVKTGTYLVSYRKQPDGAWLVTALSSTLDAPLGKGVSKMAAAAKPADSKEAR
jgi:ketosteroid isomerase-like protein